MTQPDIDSLSFKELAELTKKAGDLMKGMKNDRLKELRKKIKEMIKDEGFTVKEVFPSSSSKSSDENSDDTPKPKRVAKNQYKDPKTGKIYKGFGPRPAWLKDKNGNIIEKYKITD